MNVVPCGRWSGDKPNIEFYVEVKKKIHIYLLISFEQLGGFSYWTRRVSFLPAIHKQNSIILDYFLASDFFFIKRPTT